MQQHFVIFFIRTLDENRWALAKMLAGETQFIELATLPEFQDEFVDQLSFYAEDD